MSKLKKICLITIILIFTLSLLCSVSAVDNEDIDVKSISSENITTSDSDILMVDEYNIDSDAIDGSDVKNNFVNNKDLLRNDNTRDFLGNSYEFSGTTFDELQNRINALNDGDTLYIGNKSLISNWNTWGSPNVININVPNVKIFGGTISNPTAFSTLNGNHAKIFSLNAPGITLSNLILTHAHSEESPEEAIIITAPNCKILNSRINNAMGNNGGGISANSAATGTIIDNCNFTHNNAIWYGKGGAIELDGSNSIISNCNFIENTGANGAVYVSGSNVLIENCTFTNNNFVNGAGIYVDANYCNILNCTFTKNKATNGGAIYVAQSRKNIKIINSTLNDNSASNGGAIFMDWNSDDAIIKNTIFNNNNATSSGGALVTKGPNNLVDNCTFNNNSAFGESHNIDFGGGAIWSTFTLLNVKNSKFNNNSAPYGGALRGAFNLDNVTFINNTATDGNGGGIDLTFNDEIGSINIKINNCTFINNTANGEYDPNQAPGPGGIHNRGQGGGIHVYFSPNTNSHLDMFDNKLYNNQAKRGGGIDLYRVNSAVIENTTINYNNATIGGGIAIVGNDCIVRNTNLSNNTATNYGGAIWIIGNNSLIENTITFNNTAYEGGSTYLMGNYINVKNSTFLNNTAMNITDGTVGYGGGMFIKGIGSNIQGVFYYNKARNGSAIYSNTTNLKIHDSIFDKNQAWSYLLPITVNPHEINHGNYSNVYVRLKGGDNIANAIHNALNINSIVLNNITYLFRGHDGHTEKVSTPASDLNPKYGPIEESGEIYLPYQYDFEDNQIIIINIINNKTGEISISKSLITDCEGFVYLNASNLKVGKYKVIAVHPIDNYYTGITNESYIIVNGSEVNVVDLAVRKAVNVTVVDLGGKVLWTVTVVNNGPGVAEGVYVIDKLPVGLGYVSHNAAVGSYNKDTGRWDIGTLNNGQSVVLTITTTVINVGKITNVAEVNSTSNDTNKSNNKSNNT
ncbi:conserved repeat domain-containing protein, partial [Methanobrevibacter gottschalkii]